MDFLRLLHSWDRWLLLVVAVVAIAYFALGLLQKRAWDKNAALLLRVFPILVDIQWLLGLLFFFQTWAQQNGMARHGWEHAFTMTIALIIAHVPMAWRRKELPDNVRYRNNLLVVVGVVVVVFLGITVLPSVIQWRFYTGA
ncbi:MAG: hypothetical protein U0694_01695 [Anaerolineae bacterium]